jgi:N-methylhydantoinase B/oxoprolinase/acetone carboxylase alpha subunit
MCDVIFNTSGTYQVGVRSTSSCTSPGSYTTMTVSVSGSYLVSSGTGKQITVTLPNGTTTSTSQTIAWSLYNQTTGALAANGRIAAQGGTLDFSNLQSGIYVLSLDTESAAPDTHKIILK